MNAPALCAALPPSPGHARAALHILTAARCRSCFPGNGPTCGAAAGLYDPADNLRTKQKMHTLAPRPKAVAPRAAPPPSPTAPRATCARSRRYRRWLGSRTRPPCCPPCPRPHRQTPATARRRRLAPPPGTLPCSGRHPAAHTRASAMESRTLWRCMVEALVVLWGTFHQHHKILHANVQALSLDCAHTLVPVIASCFTPTCQP